MGRSAPSVIRCSISPGTSVNILLDAVNLAEISILIQVI